MGHLLTMGFVGIGIVLAMSCFVLILFYSNRSPKRVATNEATPHPLAMLPVALALAGEDDRDRRRRGRRPERQTQIHQIHLGSPCAPTIAYDLTAATVCETEAPGACPGIVAKPPEAGRRTCEASGLTCPGLTATPAVQMTPLSPWASPHTIVTIGT